LPPVYLMYMTLNIPAVFNVLFVHNRQSSLFVLFIYEKKAKHFNKNHKEFIEGTAYVISK
jgi:hypothetical protein